jgi:MFS-type transporter involved in bile tolerance (Atg22 family)
MRSERQAERGLGAGKMCRQDRLDVDRQREFQARTLSFRPNPEKIESRSNSLYVYSISVAIQALTVISMGGIADHRKPGPCINPAH